MTSKGRDSKGERPGAFPVGGGCGCAMVKGGVARGDTSWREGKSWERRGGGGHVVARGFEERVMGGGGACMVAVLVVVCRRRRPGPSGSDISVSHQSVMFGNSGRKKVSQEASYQHSTDPQLPNQNIIFSIAPIPQRHPLTHASPTSSSERGEVPGLSHLVAQGRRCSDWTGPVDHRPQGGSGAQGSLGTSVGCKPQANNTRQRKAPSTTLTAAQDRWPQSTPHAALHLRDLPSPANLGARPRLFRPQTHASDGHSRPVAVRRAQLTQLIPADKSQDAKTCPSTADKHCRRISLDSPCNARRPD